jgi:hypothetical protein
MIRTSVRSSSNARRCRSSKAAMPARNSHASSSRAWRSSASSGRT